MPQVANCIKKNTHINCVRYVTVCLKGLRFKSLLCQVMCQVIQTSSIKEATPIQKIEKTNKSVSFCQEKTYCYWGDVERLIK